MARNQEEQGEEQFEIKDAVRHATPQVIAVSGPTFSGKTFGAILMASGLVEPGEMVGAIDTENGRFSKYADDPDVRRVLPQGIKVIEFHPPFHPQRYIAANRALERAGCKLIITDSGTHAWDGEGGGQDMKEKDKGWKNAKLWTKRFSAALRYSTAHQIICLRAQEKVKVINGKEYIPLGIAPICEKNFYFDMELTFMVEGEVENRPATHLARPTKWPKGMDALFSGWQPQLLTPEVGKKIREWNNSGAKENPVDRLRKRACVIALDGLEAYSKFFDALSEAAKKALVASGHAANLQAAKQADLESNPEFFSALGALGYESASEIPEADRSRIMAEVEQRLADAA